jgi:hypothetical protein
VEFLQKDVDLEEELKGFEGEFERDEVVETMFVIFSLVRKIMKLRFKKKLIINFWIKKKKPINK